MRTLIVLVVFVVGLVGVGIAQPADSGSGSAAVTPAPVPAAPDSPTVDTAVLRKTCAAAMMQDPSFADSIIRKAEIQLKDKVEREQVLNDVCILSQHKEAQADIAKNERHVIMAYAAMWLVAAGFVLFLWRRQQALKTEIAQLRRDLDAATKDAT